MVQGYYTLDEASKILGIAADKLTNMAQRREIRAFADRGTWRFRTQDVEEMARRLGKGSSPDLQLGDAPSSFAAPPTAAPPKAAAKPVEEEEDLFKFDLESKDDIDLSNEITLNLPHTASGPKPGSDSDVHLVTDSDEFTLSDSAVSKQVGKSFKPLPTGKSGVYAAPPAPASPSGSGSKKAATPPADPLADSGEQLVSMDDEPGMIIPLAEDSSSTEMPALQEPMAGPGTSDSGESHAAATQEMQIDDLDAELRKAEEQTRAQTVPGKSKLKKAKGPEMPTSSPFELSIDDLEDSSEIENRTAAYSKPKKGESVKPLTPASSGEVSLAGLSSDAPITGNKGGSGINLSSPADAGINLEKASSTDSSDEIEFELSLDAESTPDPTVAPAHAGGDSSSEFELTLDDTGGLAPLEESGISAGADEKDIFETDLEIPGLDEESGSEAVPLDDADTDLESSDFDFDPDAEESGSNVVAVDEEADDAAATVARKAKSADDEGEEATDEVDEISEEDVGDLGDIEEEEEGQPIRYAPAGAAAAPANWGALPAVILFPCVVVMFLLGLMSFELLHNMWGYKQPYKSTGVVLRPISQMFGAELPNDQ